MLPPRDGGYRAAVALFYKMPVDHALASVVYGFFYGYGRLPDNHRRGLRL